MEDWRSLRCAPEPFRADTELGCGLSTIYSSPGQKALGGITQRAQYSLTKEYIP